MRVIPIIKVCGVSCNCTCSYCFYKYERDRQKIHVMDSENLELLIKEFSGLYDNIAEFDWHGGEPLLAGIEFYKEAVRLQNVYKKDNQLIINKVQTNGILVNDEWIDFFKENNFQIGISLDGPQDFHDCYRKDFSGRGTFTRTLDAYKKLHAAGVRVGIIAVVHDINSKYPDAMYHFFKDLGVRSLTLNPCKGYNIPGKKMNIGMVEPNAYARFMNRFFDLWFADDDPDFSIRQFRNILQRYYGGPYVTCSFAAECEKMLTIDYDGLIYPCEEDFFCSENAYGHLREGLQTIMSKPEFKEYAKHIREMRVDCLDCQYWHYCKGGCTRDYFDQQILQQSKNYYCQAWQEIFSHVISKVKETENKMN